MCAAWHIVPCHALCICVCVCVCVCVSMVLLHPLRFCRCLHWPGLVQLTRTTTINNHQHVRYGEETAPALDDGMASTAASHDGHGETTALSPATASVATPASSAGSKSAGGSGGGLLRGAMQTVVSYVGVLCWLRIVAWLVVDIAPHRHLFTALALVVCV